MKALKKYERQEAGFMPVIVLAAPEKEEVFEINSNEFTIGSDACCSIVLNDVSVLKYHAVILNNASSFWIDLLDGLGEMFVNGKSTKSTQLRTGDRILLGNSLLIYYDDIMQQTNEHIIRDYYIYKKPNRKT